jgi:hypothetical protein
MKPGVFLLQRTEPWELRCPRASYILPRTLFFFLNWPSGWWSPIGSIRHCDHKRLIVPAPDDYDDGEICGMIGRGNRSTRRKPASVPVCPPQNPHAALTRIRATAVGSQRLTAWGHSILLASIYYKNVHEWLINFLKWRDEDFKCSSLH